MRATISHAVRAMQEWRWQLQLHQREITNNNSNYSSIPHTLPAPLSLLLFHWRLPIIAILSSSKMTKSLLIITILTITITMLLVTYQCITSVRRSNHSSNPWILSDIRIRLWIRLCIVFCLVNAVMTCHYLRLVIQLNMRIRIFIYLLIKLIHSNNNSCSHCSWSNNPWVARSRRLSNSSYLRNLRRMPPKGSWNLIPCHRNH